MPQKSLPEPTPERIRKERLKAGLLQQQCVEMVYLGSATRWAEFENGSRPMDMARWELFLAKVGTRLIPVEVEA